MLREYFSHYSNVLGSAEQPTATYVHRYMHTDTNKNDNSSRWHARVYLRPHIYDIHLDGCSIVYTKYTHHPYESVLFACQGRSTFFFMRQCATVWHNDNNWDTWPPRRTFDSIEQILLNVSMARCRTSNRPRFICQRNVRNSAALAKGRR